MIELLTDIVGLNEDNDRCHPYKITKGAKKGMFSYTLETEHNRNYIAVDELGLRALIESGHFRDKGRIRMIPAGSDKIGSGNALSVKSYKGAAV